MSKETNEWLSENVLVGFTGVRGNAWHWREGHENHFSGAIPLEDVQRRLFSWDPVKVPLTLPDGGEALGFNYVNSETRKPICVTTETHKAHGFSEWLIQNVSNAMDDSIQIGSAGLLRGGAVAWVQLEFPENRQFAGVSYRPTILATTSLDGSIASTYKAVNTIVVCDNTRDAALSESGDAYRVRHTSNSSFKVSDARLTLGIAMEKQSEAFQKDLERMLSTSVSPEKFQSFLEKVNPIPEDKGRTKTIAENKRETLLGLWHTDPRVSIWKNTVFGVFQMINTWETHERKFKGNEAESKMMAIVNGTQFKADALSMAELTRVLQDA